MAPVPLLRWLLLTGLILAVAGCSRLGLVYNHLDTLARLELRSFVDLTPPQREAFDAALARVWQWHRSTQLPQVAAELRVLARQAQAPLPPEAIEQLSLRAGELGAVTLRRILQEAAPIVATLDDAQVASILAQIEKRSAKAQKQRARLEDEEWAEQRYDDLIDQLDDWSGSVTPAQRGRIRRWSQELIPLRSVSDDRQRRQAFAELLHTRREPELQQRLEAFFLPDPPRPRKAAERQRHAAAHQLAADLSALATAPQRAHLRERLEKLATQIERLAVQERTRVAASGAGAARR